MSKPVFIATHAALEKKPPHGQPCTRCGLCCVATLCPLARIVFGHESGPCPALSYDADGSRCGLVDNPMAYAMRLTLKNGVQAMSDAAKHLIGGGTGCDARFNGEPPDLEFYEKLKRLDEQTQAITNRARATWGIR